MNIFPVVKNDGTMLIGSFAVENFQARSSPTEQLSDRTMLELALDLMGVDDRHINNLGKVKDDNKERAFIVDIDLKEEQCQSWLNCLDKEKFKLENLKTSLGLISEISKEKLTNTF